MGKIAVLDTAVANKIAAGEVVERPASVVKELVENSIDAGATDIVIKVNRAGMDMIKVIDNGSGIAAVDLSLVFVRHATSKIATDEDLAAIGTLGFRGEALPSVAAVSKVKIKSRLAEEAGGWQLENIGGKIGIGSEVGMPPGTQIEVADLFYNTPARKKFLKSESTEMSYVINLVNKFILSHPEIAFSLERDGRLVLQAPGNNDLKAAALAVYGYDVFSALLPVYLPGDVDIAGLISAPPTCRSNRKYYNFFINGRSIVSKELSAAVDKVFAEKLPENKYPIAILHLNMPLDMVDVNVHPNKIEVRFSDADQIIGLVEKALIAALNPSYETTPNLEPEPEPVEYVWEPHSSTHVIKQKPRSISPTLCFTAPANDVISSQNDEAVQSFEEKLQISLPLAAKEQHVSAFSADTLPGAGSAYVMNTSNAADVADIADIANSDNNNYLPNDTPNTAINYGVDQNIGNIYALLTPLGQVAASFIVCTYGDDLYLIDQHAAHEHLRYEMFERRFVENGDASAMLAVPYRLEFGAAQKEILTDHLAEFADIGFTIEYFGDNTFLLRGVPAWYAGSENPEDLFIALLDKVAEEGIDCRRYDKRRVFSMACRSSVKANQYLNASDMRWLLSELSKSPAALTCPHGRPIMLKITEAELRRRFLRSQI